MSDFIEDFLAGLEGDKQKPRQGGLEKMLMSARDNQGTVVLAPFMDSITKKFYMIITNIREYRTTISTYREGNDEVWVKILPKEFYGDLTPEQLALYNEVAGLFDQLDSDLGDIPNRWNIIRVRSYSIFQGVLMNHINSEGVKLTDRLGKPVLLIFPSRQPVNELANAIKSKIVAMNNSKEWIPAVFSPTSKGREGVITISFTKPDSPGYDCNVGFEFNSAYAKVINPEEGFPEEVTKEFGDMLESFLGWQNGDNSRFNETNFNELKKILTIEIKKLSMKVENSAPEVNNNGKDPMLTSSVESPSSSTSNDPKDELPF